MIPFAILALVVAFACSGSDTAGGGTTGTPDPDEGKAAVEKEIKAADGGTLTTASGKASVTVPPGALPADAKLTVAVSAATGDAKASIYDFGPSMTFLKPVTIEIAFDGTVGSEQKAVLAWQNGSTWTEVAGSALKDGKVTGSIDHFTRFTIIFVDDKAVLTGNCADTVKSFTACGGSVVGTWALEDVCLTDTILGENPFKDTCPQATLVYEFDWAGSFTFTSDKVKMHFEAQDVVATLDIPTSCLTNMKMTCATAGESMKATCTESGGRCTCKSTQSTGEPEDEEKTYSIQGNTIVIGDGTPTEYCVKGSTAHVKVRDTSSDGKVTEFVIVLKKQ